MKKSVLLGILGLAAVAATSSYGQGYFLLNNYITGATALTYGAGIPANGVSGVVGSGGLSSAWTVGLYFTSAAVGSDPAGGGIPIAPLALGTGPGSTVAVATGNSSTPGYYDSTPFFNAGVAAGTSVNVEVIAYPTGDTYANAPYRGHSAPFSIVTVPVTSTAPNSTGQPDGVHFAGGIIVVSVVPEPTTLALAGLGGLASLVALRRKQA